MKIHEITVEGFKSIYKETTIKFPDNGLWKISGNVGVGKTTMGECILFGLFGSVRDKKLLNLVSWGAKKCKVSVSLESRGHEIIINRLVRMKGACELEIFIDGKLLEYTNKRNGQQILEEDYYDVSRTTVESLCIISFNNFKSIVHLSSGSFETRKFIDDVFGFNIVNKYVEKAKEHLSEAIAKKNEIDYEIQAMESQKVKYELARENVDSEIDCSKITSLKQQITEQTTLLNKARDSFSSQSQLIEKSRNEHMKQMNVIKERGKQVKSTIDKLSSGICPLCGSRIEPQALDDYHKQREDLLKSYNEQKVLYDKDCEDLKELQSQARTEAETINSKINKLNNEISKINLQQKLLANNYDKLINDIDASILIKKDEQNKAEQEVKKWQEFYDKIYKDSRPTLLRHYIPALNSNINFYMQELNQPYVITFDETFRVTISAYGVDDIPVSNLSTGQSKIVDTAVILGILKTLLNGVNFNMLFLDELFSNAHAELRNTICQMLKKNMNDKLIYIITHAEMDDTLFDGIIKTKLNHWEDEDGKLIQNTEYIVK